MRNFLLTIVLTFPLTIYGQGMKKNSPIETYNSPHTAKQNTWLNSRGFYVLDYDWKIQEINAKVDQAIMNRTMARVVFAAAVTSFSLGGISYLVSEMADEKDQKNDNHKAYFKVAAGLTIVSISFSLNARAKIKKAKKLRGL